MEIKKLKKLTKPLLKYLKKYFNPHTTIIIQNDSIKIVSDEIFIPISYEE